MPVTEVRKVERLFRDDPRKRPGGGLNDRPECERCGRPVRISSDDYTRDEILCPSCAAEARASELESEEHEPSRGMT